MVQWLGLGAFTARVRVRSLVRELRSRGMAKKKRYEKEPPLRLKINNTAGSVKGRIEKKFPLDF